MLTVTPQAVTKIKEILKEEGAEKAAVRVALIPVGHGFQHMLTLEEKPGEEDTITDIDGLRVVVDRESAPLLEGATIDYKEDLQRSGFVITNPNIQAGHGCACGGACDCGGH